MINSLPKLVSNFFLLCLSFTAVSMSHSAVVEIGELSDVAANAENAMEHCDEVVSERDFLETFECGDKLFETRFNARDGVGMDVGDGGRFTGVPRADLSNWASTKPSRSTGPNAEACNVCHVAESIGGAGDGAGPAGMNVIRDPRGTASPGSFIQRNTPHLFGMGGLQLLAEEMTTNLQALRDRAIAEAGENGVTVELMAKGVYFGRLTAHPGGKVDLSDVVGVADDLVVRPFQWKGKELSIRTFSRDAFHNELGMNPVELAGDDYDGDYDGVVNEITIADTTAMVLYLAAQPRPTSLAELNRLRKILIKRFGRVGKKEADDLGLPDLSEAERVQIADGARTFSAIGCAGCHSPSLTVNNPVFTEPSQHSDYREAEFPVGQNAIVHGVDPVDPISFDITVDQPDNVIEVKGIVVKRLGAFETDADGRSIVRLYGDLKRHEMGSRLAENIDETGSGPSTWMTKELRGLANTAPYLHDGRATTIEEAIIEHGGEAAGAQAKFRDLSDAEQDNVLAFLDNLVLFFPEEEE